MNSTPDPERNKSVITGLIRLLRPLQWSKNSFVAAPLVFSGEFTNPGSVRETVLAMFFFCVASSAVYIVNDLHDIEQDRLHPLTASRRPLAAGLISKAKALALLGALYLVAIAGFFRQPETMFIILAYLGLNLAYTFFLQHQPVIDIFTIAIGFVLRVYAGATALLIPVSSWMFATTLCLSLYLAAVKRRQRIYHEEDGDWSPGKYTVTLLERYAEMAGTSALLFYSLFVMTERPEMIVTIPFVLYGLFRYWYIVESLDGGDSPSDILVSDWQLLLTVLSWIGVCIWVIRPVQG